MKEKKIRNLHLIEERIELRDLDVCGEEAVQRPPLHKLNMSDFNLLKVDK